MANVFRAIYNYREEIEKGIAKNPNYALVVDNGGNYDIALTKLKEQLEEAKEVYKNWKVFYEKEKITETAKGQLAILEQQNKFAELAIKVFEDATMQMIEHNKVYNKYKEDILSTDHIRIYEGIYQLSKLKGNKPMLTTEVGMLKKACKKSGYKMIHGPLFKRAVQQANVFLSVFDTITEIGKCLGKTESQVAGARKRSFAMKLAWGSF